MLGIQWQSDPFEELASESLQNGSSINTLSVADYSIKDLEDSIVISLPLPIGTNDTSIANQSYIANCSNTSNEIVYSSQEYDRAAYCGYDLETGISDDQYDSGR